MRTKAFSVLPILAILTLTPAACGGPKGPVDVQVTLSEFKIESSLTEFSTGVPYHFTITNNGAVEHELMIMPPVSGQMTMEEMDKMALAMVEGTELPPGGSHTLDFTFKEPAPAGSLEFACHIPGHYEAGMRLPIVVK